MRKKLSIIEILCKVVCKKDFYKKKKSIIVVKLSFVIFQDDYNHSQKKAICVAAKLSLEPLRNRRICLIQGPPGTGKSHTIVGIIKRIFKVSSITSELFINRGFLTSCLLVWNNDNWICSFSNCILFLFCFLKIYGENCQDFS